MPDTAVAPPPEPADVGIVAALPIEVAPLLARFNDTRKFSAERHTVVEGYCGGKLTTLIVAGPGRKSADKGAALLLAGHRPRWLLSIGFAGALDPALKRFDVVIPSVILEPDGTRIEVGLGLPDDPGGTSNRPATLATLDSIVRTAAEKAELRAKTGADVVDMETSAIARASAERGVRFLAIRIVSDTANEDLPPEVLSILGPTGGYRVGAALGAIWKRPSSLKDLFRLRETANEAARRLGEVVARTMARLP
jgi:adenosylhomocysteine nucleosidase